MTNPTTPFSWQMPTSTDLVTDLPADFEVFGQAVATSMQDLLGGTTGQVLSKASNTNMDFTWVTQDDANAIQNTQLTAKGALITAFSSATPATLTVGNNGETLVADSSTSTGLRYNANYAAGKNGLINGAGDVSQRGATITGISSDGTYTADRWYITRGGSIDYAQKTVAGGNNPPATFDAYLQYINQSAGNAFLTIEQTLETKDSLRFAGQTVTFSFYARAAANTAKSKSLKASVTYNTTANTKANTIIGNTTFAINYGTAAGDWTRCTLTASVPSTAKSVGVRFVYEPAGGLAVGDGCEITGMQLENGSVMTQFETATGTMQGELAACQRYFAKSYSQATAPATNSSANGLVFAQSGAIVAASAYFANVALPVTMRTNPTVTIYSFTSSQTARVSDGAGTDLAASSGATNLINDARFTVQNNSGGALTAATGGFVFHYTAAAEL
jgi:hypothetical protein